MGRTKRDPSVTKEESFHRHYAAIWGEDRWYNSLFPALARPTRHAALVNAFSPIAEFYECLKQAEISREELTSPSLLRFDDCNAGHKGSRDCVIRSGNGHAREGATELVAFPPPGRAKATDYGQGLMTHWNLDAASVLAAQLLGVRAGMQVLDLCAAPGGKSLALAQTLFFVTNKTHSRQSSFRQEERQSILQSNEVDRPRFRRLNENLYDYLPSRFNVRTSNIDATSPNAHRELSIPGGWDRILVDAPCSSERHIIHAHARSQASGRSVPEMANWRPGSSKRLQETQIKLLLTALRLVSEHGKVLYATCSIEPGENDGVVDKVLMQLDKERKKGLISWSVQVGFADLGDDGNAVGRYLEREWSERTKHGFIVLPDHPSGGKWGPLYCVMLTKAR